MLTEKLKQAPGKEHTDSPNADHWKRFAMLVAHDLKEPLRNVASCARMLSTMTAAPDVDRDQIASWLEESAERVTSLVDGLLDHARLGGESTDEDVDMQRMAEEVVMDLRCLTRRSAGDICIEGLPTIKAGPLGMRLVLVNLIENALKHGKAGQTAQVDISSERTAGGWLFKVKDNGRGMTEAQVNRVFEPFRRFSGDVDGLGMGLTHVWKIIEGHRGWIDVESEPGQGTAFRFFLPA